MKTYSLAEVAEILCGDSLQRPERWLTRQIVAGRFSARKVGRHWRMTQDDLDYALDVIATPAAAPVEAKHASSGLSPRSMRNRQVVAQ